MRIAVRDIQIGNYLATALIVKNLKTLTTPQGSDGWNYDIVGRESLPDIYRPDFIIEQVKSTEIRVTIGDTGKESKGICETIRINPHSIDTDEQVDIDWACVDIANTLLQALWILFIRCMATTESKYSIVSTLRRIYLQKMQINKFECHYSDITLDLIALFDDTILEESDTALQSLDSIARTLLVVMTPISVTLRELIFNYAEYC